jgi:hypothetical protein
MSPTAYRAKFPPAASYALVPACVLRFYGRPMKARMKKTTARPAASLAADD